jgi:hypothetical protein
MKKASILFGIAVLLPGLVFSADYNLGQLARSNKIEVFNRTLDQAKAGAPEVVFLNSAEGYGLAWVTGVDFSKGIIEVDIKGRNTPGRSFVGIAFHGQDNKTFDAVYLRPFNFQAADSGHRHHAIQYISIPGHDWDDLRKNYPGKYEAALIPPPAPEPWVKLKLVGEDKNVSAFVNGGTKPALNIELLNDHHKGKLGLWVGNGSDGWFKNFQVTPAAK